ncbi:MAG: type II toxin-antitoxin system RelB/DinJ family antitoxin [Firmicutes bacterium]|nr:type II toxin-antitoxin system RelB/DinJ family antitoxin [Bacillota bacterium]
MGNVQVSTRLDDSIRDAATEVLEREGLDLPTLFKIVATQTASYRQIPILFNQTFNRKSHRRIEAEHRISELIKPQLKNAKCIDPNNPNDIAEMLDGWET